MVTPQDKCADVLMTPEQVADWLHVKTGTLANWRSDKRYNLPYMKIGRLVLYSRNDVQNFINSRRKEMPGDAT